MLSNNTPKGGGLYILRLSDTHYYGGRATKFKRRWRNHLRELRAGTHDNIRMQRVFNIHGRFEPEVLRVLARDEHQDAEQEWLDANFRKPGCVNINPSACGGCESRSPETRAKMSETRRSRPDLVAQARAQLIRSNKARTGEERSEAYKDALSRSLRGKTQSPEHVEKRAESHRGRKNTEETKALMSKSAKRRAQEQPTSHSEETRALISSQQKGRVWINNGTRNTRIHPTDLPGYLDQGWVRGRFR